MQDVLDFVMEDYSKCEPKFLKKISYVGESACTPILLPEAVILDFAGPCHRGWLLSLLSPDEL